jgi:hypothetical protein
VTFLPPDVGVVTPVALSVVATDALGAISLPANVVLAVLPALCDGDFAAVTSGGLGKPGALGTPNFEAINLPKLPSNDFGLRLTRAFPNRFTYLIFGFGFVGVPYDFGVLYPSPDLLIAANTDALGEIEILNIALQEDAAVCGLVMWGQAIVFDDPGAAGPEMTAQSNWLRLTFGD